MTHPFWTRNTLAVAAAVVTVVCIVSAISIGLAVSQPFQNEALGPDWQCSRLAFLFTTCTPIVRAQTASVLKGPACPRRTVWRTRQEPSVQ